jgi:hypothetical protein
MIYLGNSFCNSPRYYLHISHGSQCLSSVSKYPQQTNPCGVNDQQWTSMHINKLLRLIEKKKQRRETKSLKTLKILDYNHSDIDYRALNILKRQRKITLETNVYCNWSSIEDIKNFSINTKKVLIIFCHWISNKSSKNVLGRINTKVLVLFWKKNTVLKGTLITVWTEILSVWKQMLKTMKKLKNCNLSYT